MPSEFHFAAALYGADIPPVGLYALRDAVRSLRETGRFIDDEGEATNALEDLLDRITDGVHDATTAEALRCLRNVKVLLGTDSPEVRGWAPAVQQATQKSINTAIQTLARGVVTGAPEQNGGTDAS